MIEWRRLYAKPAGSLPGGIVTQWGAGIVTLLVLVFLTYWIYFGGGEEAKLASATETDQVPGESFIDRMAAQVEAESLRAEMRRQAEERLWRQQEQRQQQQPGSGTGAAGMSADEARLLAGPSSETGQPYTEEEWELRERLRLEAVERRSRSFRSSPVAQTYRRLDGGTGARPRQRAEPASPAEARRAEGSAALEEALGTIAAATAGLEDEVAAEADRVLIEALKGTPATTAPAVSAVPAASAGPASREDSSLPRLAAPEDPPGWERIHEGSFLEAVLVTQLSGDFPGPVLAVVSVPFYSGDRQRVLVPRGARIIGTARAVANQDQSRLAVSFHRLILPDGRSVSLEFHGLNQVGEGALKDQVNRHYFSMFAAVGAVGVLSGLTAARGNPYEGGVAGFQAGAGQGLGQAATRILDRFLNRLPTITIRAGHRLRVWFTSDVLVPRPLKKGD